MVTLPMFICHACGNCTKPREPRTVLPVYYAAKPLQIKREVWLCQRCVAFTKFGSESDGYTAHYLGMIVADRLEREAVQSRQDEIIRIGEENYRRERDRMRVESMRANRGQHVETLVRTEALPLPEPVKPRGSFQANSAEQPTLSELLKRARGGKPVPTGKPVVSHAARCLVCGAFAKGGVTVSDGTVYCASHAP
jgi:hypothetical protein